MVGDGPRLATPTVFNDVEVENKTIKSKPILRIFCYAHSSLPPSLSLVFLDQRDLQNEIVQNSLVRLNILNGIKLSLPSVCEYLANAHQESCPT